MKSTVSIGFFYEEGVDELIETYVTFVNEGEVEIKEMPKVLTKEFPTSSGDSKKDAEDTAPSPQHTGPIDTLMIKGEEEDENSRPIRDN